MTRVAQRVLVLGLNYPPEPTGISPYTGAMARGLARGGLQIRVLTAHPHYPNWRIAPGYGQWVRVEQTDGVSVTRLRHYVPHSPSGFRRALSEFSFGLRLSLTRWGNPDVIVAVSPALISTCVALGRARLTHRATPFVVWVQDLYSLGLEETGQGGKTSRVVVHAIERWVLRHATRIVVIHDRFARRIVDQFGVSPESIRVVPNWTHLKPTERVDVEAQRAALGWHADQIIVLHAGNMGVKQGLDNVVAAARLAQQVRAPVRFVLVGGGSEKEALRASAEGVRCLDFMDPLPDAEYAAAMQSADVLLVNERPGVAEMAVPSKLTSYFDAGRPVIAATDPAGVTAEELSRADAGIVVPPGDPSALLESAMKLAQDVDRARSLGANGMRYRRSVLDEGAALDRITDVLAELRPDLASPRHTPDSTNLGRSERSKT